MNELRSKTNIEEERFEELVREYRRPLLICAGRAVHRYITEQDEEWSIALLAFHEAVKNYSSEKGEFWPFASTVVRRRLTDHLRSVYAHAETEPVDPSAFTGDPDAGTEVSGIETEVRTKLSDAAEINSWPGQYTIADEIQAVQQQLQKYGFSFYDLTLCSPKAEKSRRKCAEAAAVLLQNPEMLENMERTGTMPVKELAKKSGVSRKVLEKHRRYLIAAVVILSGDYPLLGEYLRPVREVMGELCVLS